MIFIFFFEITLKLLNGKGIDNFNITESCCNNYCFVRVIWVFWEQDNVDKFVLDIIRVSKESLTNFTLIFLSKNNISDFLDLKHFPKGYFKTREGNPNRADYVRISLLEKYGGIWLDASVIVNSGIEMEWFVSQAVEFKSQMIAFKYSYMDHDIHFCFLGAPGGSFVMKMFKEEYDRALTIGIREYTSITCKYLLGKKVNLFMRCLDVPSTYFMMDTIFTNISFENSTINNGILRLSEIRGPNRLFLECKHKKECFVARFLHDQSVKNYPLIKIFGHVRRLILRAEPNVRILKMLKRQVK